jgi:hypothetical protein
LAKSDAGKQAGADWDTEVDVAVQKRIDERTPWNKTGANVVWMG